MARKTTISREGLEFLIGAVKNTINIGDIINNEDLADNKTYSNIKIEERMDDKIDASALLTKTELDKTNAKLVQLETQVDDLFQSVSDGKTLVANAITDKGVSTATNATFATMATNIGKINGYGYKEETKSKTFNTTGISVLTITFSANVLAIKQIVSPSNSCSIVLQSSNNIYTINGKELIVHVIGGGTWSFTALIQN